MSDIYLQITETPTVVTLSAPVISGALSSTVTVANVVTVALDSNSLSALENVTVTVGAAVSISNFPATQTIAGTVTANGVAFNEGEVTPDKAIWIAYNSDNTLQGVGNSAPLPISGTVTANVPTITNFPISFRDEIGDQIVVNNTGQSLPVQVFSPDGGSALFQNSLPISGTVTIGSAIPAGTNRIGVVTIGGGTVTIGAGTSQIGSVTASISGTVPISISSVTVGNSVTIGSLPAISGTVTANLSSSNLNTVTIGVRGSVTVGNTTQITDSVVLGFNNIFGNNDTFKVDIRTPEGSVLDGEASVPVQGTVDIGSLPAISGTVTANLTTESFSSQGGIASDGGGGEPSYGVQLGYYDGDYKIVNPSQPLPISGTVTANTFAVQGTAVTTSNFTSTTASTVLANYNATRQVLTIFNEGAGNLHVCVGATCTTIAYQVRLSSGDYYEVPNHQTTITHSAVFSTAGTARVTEVS
jgi:hypothetical protein